MAELYEFHDSVVAGMEEREEKLILRMKAYLHLQPEGSPEEEWTGWTQRFEIEIEKPVVEGAFLSFPADIYDGSLTAAEIDANPEDVVGLEIPASLRVATNVEIKISGSAYHPDEYRDMVIRGSTARIVRKEDPVFVEW